MFKDFHTEIPDPWETPPAVAQPKAPPEFIRQIEAQLRHDSEHLMMSATLNVPQIAAPRSAENAAATTASEITADRILLQDEIKLHDFAKSKLAQAIEQVLALIWWSRQNQQAS